MMIERVSRKLIGTVFIFCLLMVTAVEASPLKKDTSNLDINNRAQVVISGYVDSVNSYWVDNDLGHYIETKVMISIEKFHKNEIISSTPKQIELKYEGGQVGDFILKAYMNPGGCISLKEGEHVKLYAIQQKDGLFIIGKESYDDLPTESIELGIESYSPPASVYENYGWGFRFSDDCWDTAVSSVTYQINPNCVDISGTNEAAPVQAAFTTWNNLGTIKVAFSRGTDTLIATNDPNDGVNAIYWVNRGVLMPVATCYLGIEIGTSGKIISFDIACNEDLTWYIGASSGKYDVQSVLTHEAGHVLGIEDLVTSAYYSANTMWYEAPKNSITWRSLETGDKAGGQYAHPKYSVPTVSISLPTDNQQWSVLSYGTIEATSSVYSGTITECVCKITTQNGYTYDSGWITMLYSSGKYTTTWYTGTNTGYYLVSVRTKSNYGMYGYHQHTVYIPPI